MLVSIIAAVLFCYYMHKCNCFIYNFVMREAEINSYTNIELPVQAEKIENSDV